MCGLIGGEMNVNKIHHLGDIILWFLGVRAGHEEAVIFLFQ